VIFDEAAALQGSGHQRDRGVLRAKRS
jgi:hypothetical protein